MSGSGDERDYDWIGPGSIEVGSEFIDPEKAKRLVLKRKELLVDLGTELLCLAENALYSGLEDVSPRFLEGATRGEGVEKADSFVEEERPACFHNYL